MMILPGVILSKGMIHEIIPHSEMMTMMMLMMILSKEVQTRYDPPAPALQGATGV